MTRKEVEHFISLHYHDPRNYPLSKDLLNEMRIFVGWATDEDIELSRKKYRETPLTKAYDKEVRGKDWKKGARSLKLVSLGSTSPNPLRRKGYKV